MNAPSERVYTDFDRAFAYTALFTSTGRLPADYQVEAALHRLTAEREARWVAVGAVGMYRVAVRKIYVDAFCGTVPCKMPIYRPVLVHKGLKEETGLYWADMTDYGLTARELVEYEDIVTCITQLRELEKARYLPQQARYLHLLTSNTIRLHNKILQFHGTWLRRRAAIAAFNAANTAAAPAPAPVAAMKSEW